MHNETTLFYYIEKLHRLCFQLFSHFQNINETYFSFVKLFFVRKWDDFNETTIQGNFLKTIIKAAKISFKISTES